VGQLGKGSLNLFYYIGSAEGHEYPDLQVGGGRTPFDYGKRGVNEKFFFPVSKSGQHIIGKAVSDMNLTGLKLFPDKINKTIGEAIESR